MRCDFDRSQLVNGSGEARPIHASFPEAAGAGGEAFP